MERATPFGVRVAGGILLLLIVVVVTLIELKII